MVRPVDDSFEKPKADEPPRTAQVIDLPTELWRRPGFVLSDDNLAECVVEESGDAFAYSHRRRVWRWYDGTRWVDDALLPLHQAITERLKEVAVFAARKPKDKLRMGSRSTVLSVEGSMRHRLTVDEALFDANPWLLNCPSGTVDLKYAGAPLTMRKHDRRDYLTKAVVADPLGDCPLWLEFIEFVAGGDAGLAAYLQRLCGYALVGISTEQMLAFLYGTGANGKSVLLQTLLHVLQDYAVTAQMSTFTASKQDRHSEELMVLRGARLIVASETGSDQKWDDVRIKQLTGGEKIRARYMRENSVEFELNATLIIAGNNKPELDNVDEGIRRRLHIVPFMARVSDEMRDDHLAGKLRREAGGILKWCIEGCRLWQGSGLQPPEAVTSATAEYLSEEDHVRQWREQELIDNPDSRVSNTDLFGSWKRYAMANGIEAETSTVLGKRLAKMGLDRFHIGSERGFKRIALRAELEKSNSESTFWSRR